MRAIINCRVKLMAMRQRLEPVSAPVFINIRRPTGWGRGGWGWADCIMSDAKGQLGKHKHESGGTSRDCITPAWRRINDSGLAFRSSCEDEVKESSWLIEAVAPDKPQ